VVLAFSPARLAGMGLDIQEVADALRAQNAVVPAGTMRTGQENMAIKVSGALTTEESLRAVTLHNNRYIPLTDIATVTGNRRATGPGLPGERQTGYRAGGVDGADRQHAAFRRCAECKNGGHQRRAAARYRDGESRRSVSGGQ
jgi:hypothetical protein